MQPTPTQPMTPTPTSTNPKKSNNWWLLALQAVVGQIIARLLARLPWPHFPVHWLDVWLCMSALLVLFVFESAQAKAGRTTPLAAFLTRLSRAK